MKAADLKLCDIVSKPNGLTNQKWEHTIIRFNNQIVYSKFDNGVNDVRPTWMSMANMDSCLKQPDTVVHRGGQQIHPEVTE